VEEENAKVELYKRMLLKYRELIENNEAKSVSELKELVNPYIYAEHFPAAAQLAIQKVMKIKTVELPLNFWLSIEDMVALGVGDAIDKAILLCSLLRAMDCEDVWVVVTKTKEAHVLFKKNGIALSVDIANGGTTEVASVGEGLKRFELAYKFNDREYEEF